MPKVRLEVLAYHTSIVPPESVKLDSSVLLNFCPIGQNFEVQINDAASTQNLEYAHALRTWRSKFDGDISIYTYYRNYAWDSLPAVIPHYIQKDMQFYQSVPVQGISTYSEPGDWGTYEINHYALAKLAQDPAATADIIVQMFCKTRSASASKTAGKAYSVLERVVPRHCTLPGTTTKSASELKCAEDEVRNAQKEFDGAAGKNKVDYATSVSIARLHDMLEYAARDIDVERLRVESFRIDMLMRKVQQLHSFLQEHGDEGVFLVRGKRLSEANLVKKYVR